MKLRIEDSKYNLEVVTKYNYMGAEIINTEKEETKMQGRINNLRKCESWKMIEKYRVAVDIFEKRVLRRIYGIKKVEDL